MKKQYFFIPIYLFFITHLSFTQTIIPGGDVSGTWIVSQSPYLVEGEINIPLDNTLTIEPGVVVKFNGHYKFIIYGCFLAEGNENDSIRFTTDDPETGWHGLRFLDTETNSQPVSRITFSVIEYGKSFGTCPDNSGAGIFISHSVPLIANNTIRNNSATNGNADWGGGGIYCEYSNPEIRDNLITGNYSGHDGGGIYCGFNSPLITNNKIINNEAAHRGGGIATFSFASPHIVNNEIADNEANSIGGGIYQSGGNSIIEGNTISNNYAADGGGIACYLSSSKLYNNLLTDNEAYRGAGFWNQGSSPNILNNTVINNVAYASGGGMYNITGMAGVPVYSNPLTVNNILYLNTAEEGSQIFSVVNNIPVLWHNDIEGLTEDGISGDYNQQDGNIDAEPHFDIEGEHECALSDDSECIDNGVNGGGGFELPVTDILGNIRIWDGNNDGSDIADMGAYEYGSSPVGILEDGKPLNRFVVNVFPNPFVTSIYLSFLSDNHQQIKVSIYSLKGEELHVLANEKFLHGEQQLYFNIEWFPSGIYLLTFESNNEVINTTRMIKIAD